MDLATRERDNLLRWDGKRRGFYEVYFLTFYDRASGVSAWLRYTLTSPKPGHGEPCCELWGVVFDPARAGGHLALKETHPIRSLSWERERFGVRLAGAELRSGACSGSLGAATGGARLAWDLRFDSSGPSLRHFPYPIMYRGPIPRTKVLSPHVYTRFSGRLEISGRTLRISDAPGQQAHLWGTQHAWRWAWTHANVFAEDSRAVFEGLDCDAKFGPLRAPHLMMYFLRVGGREHLYATAAQCLTNTSRWGDGRWSFELFNGQLRVVGEARADPKDFVGVTYRDPDGGSLVCNNTGLADLRLRLFDAGGRSQGVLTCARAGSLEMADRAPDPRIPVVL